MPKRRVKVEAPGLDEDFRAESDMRTLIEAERIRNDKGRFKKAMMKAKEEKDAVMAAVGEDNKKGA